MDGWAGRLPIVSGDVLRLELDLGRGTLVAFRRNKRGMRRLGVILGLYPIATFQYSSTTLHQVSDHIRYLFF